MGSSGSSGYSQKYVDDLRKKNEAAERRFLQQMHDLTVQAQTSKAQHDQTILTLQSQQREASLENKMKLELLKQQQEATKAQSERALAVLQRQQDEAKAQSARALESMEEMCRDTKEQLRTQTQQNEELKKQMSELRKKFEAPLRERKKIVTKINDMKLVIRIRSGIILMGSKGVGKSTFLHLIREGLGKPSNSSSDGTKKFQYGEKFIDSIGADILDEDDRWVIEAKNAVAPIGHGDSKTTHVLTIKTKEGVLADSPGFLDTRGHAADFVNGLRICNALRHARSIRLVVVIRASEVESLRGKIIGDLMKQLARFLTPVEKVIPAMALFITRGPAEMAERRALRRQLKRAIQGDALRDVPAAGMLLEKALERDLLFMDQMSGKAPHGKPVDPDIYWKIIRSLQRFIPDDVRITVPFEDWQHQNLVNVAEIYLATITVNVREFSHQTSVKKLEKLQFVADQLQFDELQACLNKAVAVLNNQICSKVNEISAILDEAGSEGLTQDSVRSMSMHLIHLRQIRKQFQTFKGCHTAKEDRAIERLNQYVLSNVVDGKEGLMDFEDPSICRKLSDLKQIHENCLKTLCNEGKQTYPRSQLLLETTIKNLSCQYAEKRTLLDAKNIIELSPTKAIQISQELADILHIFALAKRRGLDKHYDGLSSTHSSLIEKLKKQLAECKFICFKGCKRFFEVAGKPQDLTLEMITKLKKHLITPMISSAKFLYAMEKSKLRDYVGEDSTQYSKYEEELINLVDAHEALLKAVLIDMKFDEAARSVDFLMYMKDTVVGDYIKKIIISFLEGVKRALAAQNKKAIIGIGRSDLRDAEQYFVSVDAIDELDMSLIEEEGSSCKTEIATASSNLKKAIRDELTTLCKQLSRMLNNCNGSPSKTRLNCNGSPSKTRIPANSHAMYDDNRSHGSRSSEKEGESLIQDSLSISKESNGMSVDSNQCEVIDEEQAFLEMIDHADVFVPVYQRLDDAFVLLSKSAFTPVLDAVSSVHCSTEKDCDPVKSKSNFDRLWFSNECLVRINNLKITELNCQADRKTGGSRTIIREAMDCAVSKLRSESTSIKAMLTNTKDTVRKCAAQILTTFEEKAKESSCKRSIVTITDLLIRVGKYELLWLDEATKIWNRRDDFFSSLQDIKASVKMAKDGCKRIVSSCVRDAERIADELLVDQTGWDRVKQIIEFFENVSGHIDTEIVCVDSTCERLKSSYNKAVKDVDENVSQLLGMKKFKDLSDTMDDLKSDKKRYNKCLQRVMGELDSNSKKYKRVLRDLHFTLSAGDYKKLRARMDDMEDMLSYFHEARLMAAHVGKDVEVVYNRCIRDIKECLTGDGGLEEKFIFTATEMFEFKKSQSIWAQIKSLTRFDSFLKEEKFFTTRMHSLRTNVIEKLPLLTQTKFKESLGYGYLSKKETLTQEEAVKHFHKAILNGSTNFKPSRAKRIMGGCKEAFESHVSFRTKTPLSELNDAIADIAEDWWCWMETSLRKAVNEYRLAEAGSMMHKLQALMKDLGKESDAQRCLQNLRSRIAGGFSSQIPSMPSKAKLKRCFQMWSNSVDVNYSAFKSMEEKITALLKQSLADFTRKLKSDDFDEIEIAADTIAMYTETSNEFEAFKGTFDSFLKVAENRLKTWHSNKINKLRELEESKDWKAHRVICKKFEALSKKKLSLSSFKLIEATVQSESEKEQKAQNINMSVAKDILRIDFSDGNVPVSEISKKLSELSLARNGKREVAKAVQKLKEKVKDKSRKTLHSLRNSKLGDTKSAKEVEMAYRQLLETSQSLARWSVAEEAEKAAMEIKQLVGQRVHAGKKEAKALCDTCIETLHKRFDSRDQKVLRRLDATLKKADVALADLKSFIDATKACVKNPKAPEQVVQEYLNAITLFATTWETSNAAPTEESLAEHICVIHAMRGQLSHKMVQDSINSLVGRILTRYRAKIDIGTLASILEGEGSAAEVLDSHSCFKRYRAEQFNKLVSQITPDHAATEMEKLNQKELKITIPKQKMLEIWQEYAAVFKKHRCSQENLSRTAKTLKREIGRLNLGMWNTATPRIPKIFGVLCGLWSRWYKQHNGVDVVPHVVQILTIFRLLGVDQKSPPENFWGLTLRLFTKNYSANPLNHLTQIETGGGKSIVLGLLATFLALMNIKVHCACYSAFLSKRDKKSFSGFWKDLGISCGENVNDLITYSTLKNLSNILLNEDVNLRQCIGDFVQKGTELKRKATKRNWEIRVLLIDEVDVFFSEDFYGSTYNPAVKLKGEEEYQLIKAIWSMHRKLGKVNISDAKSTPEFKAVETKYSRHPWIARNAIGAMTHCLSQFKDHSYETVKHQGAIVIAYKQHGGLTHSKDVGYLTSFAYMQELDKGVVTEENVKQKVGINITIGEFSYAEFPKPGQYFHLILGVTGTLTSMSKFESQIVENQYEIKQRTITPTIYANKGADLFKKVDVKLEQTRLTYWQKMAQMIVDVAGTNGAILVYFEDNKAIADFQASEYGRRVEKLYNPRTVTEHTRDKETKITLATRMGQVTYFPRIFGRGLDFKCRDKRVEEAGGVFVLQTFFSASLSEETQIKGRTARQGKKGRYQMLLCVEDLEKAFNVEGKQLNEELEKARLYDFLHKTREEHTQKIQKKREAKVKKAFDANQESKLVLRNILDGDYEQLPELLKKMNNRGSKYHFGVCLDASGSMKGRPWQDLCAAFKAFVKSVCQTCPDHWLTTIVFSSRIQVQFDKPLRDAAGFVPSFINGGTDFGPPLTEAFNKFNQPDKKEYTPYLIFMSDGDGINRDRISMFRPLLNRELQVRTIFFGRGSGSQHMKHIAEYFGPEVGSYNYSADGIQLKETFSKSIVPVEISSTVSAFDD